MNKSVLKNNPIPISPSLNSAIEEEESDFKKGDDKIRLLKISFAAFLVAIAVSAIAKFLIHLIDLITNLSFYQNFSFIHTTPASNSLGLWVIIVPALGGVIVGFILL